jgi:hypothetical protein
LLPPKETGDFFIDCSAAGGSGGASTGGLIKAIAGGVSTTGEIYLFIRFSSHPDILEFHSDST